MIVAVVGNGPSALVHRAEWERADLVVRCNVYGPGRCDVWASHFDAEVLTRARAAGLRPELPRALWSAISPAAELALRPDCPCGGNARRTAELAGQPWRQISDADWIALVAAAGERRPSTGLCAVRMALDLLPDALVLAGFDAELPAGPGWGSEAWDWAAEPGRHMPHNWPAEKVALARLAEGSPFAGCWWRTAVRWLRLPGADTAEPRGGGMATRLAHAQETAGSTPAPATTSEKEAQP